LRNYNAPIDIFPAPSFAKPLLKPPNGELTRRRASKHPAPHFIEVELREFVTAKIETNFHIQFGLVGIGYARNALSFANSVINLLSLLQSGRMTATDR
jgi:hypothetical protein